MNKNEPFGPKMYREYKGALHIRCSACGKEKTFKPSRPITHFICDCGQVTELGKLKTAWMNCECGNMKPYHTNISERFVEIECIRCGQPAAMEFINKKGLYQTIKYKERK